MVTLYLLFNHQITPVQQDDARNALGIGRIVDLPPDLQRLWSAVPPELDAIGSHLAPIQQWLAAHAAPGDFLLVQGDFGATCLMVAFAFQKGLVPIYSTTKRQAVETILPNGGIQLTHSFQHERFRRYGA